MKRILTISLTTIAVCAVVILTGRALLAGPVPDPRVPDPNMQMRIVSRMTLVAPTDPTGLPLWRPLSDDLGILLREDDRWGYRGGLYAQIDGKWWPIAIDGIDSIGAVPLKR